MAAKKKKTPTKTYGNKTKFVLGLPREMSAKEVVAEAKKQGITITEAHVYKIRSTAKSKGGAVPKGKRGARAAAPGKTMSNGGVPLSKREFVLSFSPETKASEILRQAKEAGIGLSKAYLYTIRSAGGASQGRGRKIATPEVTSGRLAGARARGTMSSLEEQFVDAAIDLGLSKATELLERLRSRLKDGV